MIGFAYRTISHPLTACALALSMIATLVWWIDALVRSMPVSVAADYALLALATLTVISMLLCFFRWMAWLIKGVRSPWDACSACEHCDYPIADLGPGPVTCPECGSRWEPPRTTSGSEA